MKAMRLGWLLLLLLVPASDALRSAAVSAAQPPPPNDSNRLPNDETKYRYPRWLPMSLIDPQLSGQNIESNVRNLRMTVDSRNTVHLLGLTNDGNLYLRYYSSAYDKRKANGFSDAAAPFPTGTDPNNIILCDVAAGPAGAGATDKRDWIHVVYSKSAQSGPIYGEDLFYVRWTGDTAGTGWSAPVNLTNIPAVANKVITYKYPRIEVSPASGQAHVVASYDSHLTSGSPPPPTLDIAHLVVDAGGSSASTDHLNAGANYVTGPVLLAMGSDVHVGWTQPATTSAYKHASWSSLGGWSAVEDVVQGTTLQGWDLAADQTAAGDDVHAAYMSSGVVRYKKKVGGAAFLTAAVEDVSSQPIPTLVKISVDRQHQPHLIWTESQKFCYAGRVFNPALGSSTPWAGKQEYSHDFEEYGEGQKVYDLSRVIAHPSGGLFVLGRTDSGSNKPWFFSRSVEYNLGQQDPAAMYPVGARAAANLANGNLFMNFPLFGSQGAGLTNSVSLIWNSQNWEPGPISPGWGHSYHVYLTDSKCGINDTVRMDIGTSPITADIITLFMGDGRAIPFRWQDTDPGQNQKYCVAYDEFGYFGRIERSTATLQTEYKLTTKNGVLYTFRDDGKLREIKDLNQNVQTLVYVSGRLSTVTDTMGRVATFTYDASGNLTKVDTQAADAVEHQLAYDATLKNLITLTVNNTGLAAEKPIWRFEYHAADDLAFHFRKNLISKVTTPYPADFLYYYYQDSRFQRSQDPTLSTASMGDAGGTVSPHPPRTVVYQDPAVFAPLPVDQPRADVTDRRNNPWKFVFESRKSLVTKIIDPLTKATARTFNNNYRNLSQVTDPEANVTAYVYTHESGTKEKPLYVKDNLRSVSRPSPNNTSGNQAAAIATETYTYFDGNGLVNTLVTQSPAGAGTVSRSFPRDSSGNVQTISYPTTRNQVTLVDLNPSESFLYSGNGQVTTATAPGGGTTSITPDSGCGLPHSVTRPGHGSGTVFAYDGMGFMTQSTTPMGGATGYQLDGLHRVKKVTGPMADGVQAITDIQYDKEASRITQVDLPDSGQGRGQIQNSYDELGRLVQRKVLKTAGTFLTTTFRYDPEGNLRELTDPRGVKATRTYTSRNQVSQLQISGTTDPVISTVYDYSDAGNLNSETTGGQQISYVRNAWGMARTASYPAGASDSYTYNNDGSIAYVVRTEGATFRGGTLQIQDAMGRACGSKEMMSATPSASDLATTLGLDADGNVTEVRDPSNRVFTHSYDSSGRRIDSRNAGNVLVAHRTYDQNDNMLTAQGVDPRTGIGLIDVLTCTYTARDQVKTSKNALNYQTGYTYHAGGELNTVTDPKLFVTKYDYNLVSQATRMTRDYGGGAFLTQYDYDGSGNLSQVTDPRLNNTIYTYSSLGRLKSSTYPSSAADVWTFDSKGRAATWVSRRGITATYGYDGMDRRTSALYQQSGTTVANILSSYDGASNLTQCLNATTQVSKVTAYDGASRPTSVQIILGRTTLVGGGTLWKGSSYTWKPDSQVDTYANSEGHLYQYGYEAGTGALQTVTRNTPVPAKTYGTYFRDATGRLRETLLQNGTATFNDYDAAGRLSKVRSVNSGGTVLSSFAYTLDEDDRRTGLLLGHMGASVTYGYNSRSFLTSETWPTVTGGADPFTNTLVSGNPGNEAALASLAPATAQPANPSAISAYSETYGYDANGNRNARSTVLGAVTTNYTYVPDVDNRITSESQQIVGGALTNVAYGYGGTANANILTRTIGTTVETYSYDYQERLTGYIKQVGGSTTANYGYQYLPTGERLSKVNAAGGAGNEEWYYPDGPDVTADYTKTTGQPTYTLASTYVNGGGIDSKLARITSAGTELYYLGDGLGSVHRVINASQLIQNTTLTTAWGLPHPGFTPVVGQPDRYGFTQREADSESGLLQFRARAYDPRLGRFTQTDPILGNRATKHYAYAGNNPVSFIDPFGLDADDWNQVKGLVTDVDWVRKHKRLVYTGFSSGGQEVFDGLYASYRNAVLRGYTGASMSVRLEDVKDAFLEDPQAIAARHATKLQQAKQLLMIQGMAVAANLEGIAAARALTESLPSVDSSSSRSSSGSRSASKAEPVAEAVDSGVSKEEYAILRKKTPNQAMRDAVNPPGPKFDPVYGTPVPTLEADHIVSMREIVKMPGFKSLSDEAKSDVLNFAKNFMGLGKRSNASKGAKSWSEWPGHSQLGPVPADVRAGMLEAESEARQALQQAINERLGK
jgi:RHS repeat-associated protein